MERRQRLYFALHENALPSADFEVVAEQLQNAPLDGGVDTVEAAFAVVPPKFHEKVPNAFGQFAVLRRRQHRSEAVHGPFDEADVAEHQIGFALKDAVRRTFDRQIAATAVLRAFAK